MFAAQSPRVLAIALPMLFALVGTAVPRAMPPQVQPPQESVRTERARWLSQRYLEDAQRLRQAGRNEEALALLLAAKELTPTDENVLNALASLQAELSPDHPGTGQTYAQQMERLWRMSDVLSL
jgi:hypothetical protein